MSERPQRPRLVTSTVAARALGVSTQTLWRWKKAGFISPDAVTQGGHFRWNVDRLLAIMEQWRRDQNGPDL